MSLNKLSMTEEVLAPKGTIKFSYKGHQPSSAINIIKTVAKKNFRVPTKNWYENEFTFVDIGPEVELYAQWNAKNKFDKYTKYDVRLIFHMYEGKKTKDGDFTLSVRPIITTSFSYKNFLERLFYKIFMRMFYYNRRRQYMDTLKEWALDFKEDILNAFNINVKEDLEGI